MMLESLPYLPSGSQTAVTPGRLHNRDLLTLPRTASAKTAVTGNEIQGSAISEDELQNTVQKNHASSQEYLFNLFKKELQSYNVRLERFELEYLLHKIGSWLSEVSKYKSKPRVGMTPDYLGEIN